MYDLHQALRSYDENNKLVLANFTEAILKRYETEEQKQEMKKKLLQMVQLKRRQSHSKDALQLIQSMEPNSQKTAGWLLEGLVSYLYPKDENFKPDGRYWFDYTDFEVRNSRLI